MVLHDTTPTPATLLHHARANTDDANLGTNGGRSLMFACGRHALLTIARRQFRDALGLPMERIVGLPVRA